MTQSVYSWMGSPLHLILNDDFAQNYNQAQDAFFESQMEFVARTQTEWNGSQPLTILWTEEQRLAWNKMADLINLLVEMAGGGLDIPIEQCTSDYLIKL